MAKGGVQCLKDGYKIDLKLIEHMDQSDYWLCSLHHEQVKEYSKKREEERKKMFEEAMKSEHERHQEPSGKEK